MIITSAFVHEALMVLQRLLGTSWNEHKKELKTTRAIDNVVILQSVLHHCGSVVLQAYVTKHDTTARRSYYSVMTTLVVL